jgi:dihydroflavonol-4-reductase
VTGASGFVGGWVVEKLVERGARVRCLVRPESNRGFLPSDRIEFAPGNVTDALSVERAMVGCDYVFHVAGLIKARDPAEYIRVNRGGTINVLDTARNQSGTPPRVVLISSLAAIGPSQPGAPADESWNPRPVSPYGKSKLLAEIASQSYASDVPMTIVRPPLIYGPRDRETLQAMRLAGLPIRPSFGSASEYSAIHVSDLADGILLAATRPEAIGKAYFLSGDETHTMDGLVEIIAQAIGSRGISVRVPMSVILAAGVVSEVIRNATGVPLIFDRWKARDVAAAYWACSNQRARLELGFEPRFSLREGIFDTVRWYRKVGWLR